jgi:NAD(P)-dependent dehydrogenase (short-subunit alcohol dehydrogenase family)
MRPSTPRTGALVPAQLAQQNAKVKVSVGCPGGVNTRIALATRNRPDELWDRTTVRPSAEELERRVQEWAALTGGRGMRPEDVATRVF